MDKAAEEPGPKAGLALVLGDHPALTQGDDLFAGGDDISGLIEGLDVLLHQIQVALAHLDKVGGDGVTGVFFALGLNDHALSFIGVKIHG